METLNAHFVQLWYSLSFDFLKLRDSKSSKINEKNAALTVLMCQH